MKTLSRRVISGHWEYVRRDPRQPPGADKPGLLSLSAPSLLELDVGPVQTGGVALGFLKSYDERMGELHVSCQAGCACNATTLHAWHARRSSVLAFGMVPTMTTDARPQGSSSCVLRLMHVARRAGRATPRLAGPPVSNTSSKFKLAAVVVPPWQVDPGDHDLASARGLNLA